MHDIEISVNFDSPFLGTDPETESGVVHLEVNLDDESVLFGTWSSIITHHGKGLRPAGEWSEIATVSSAGSDGTDSDTLGCDFLELDLPLEQDYRLQRFFLMDHADHLLIMGDTVLYEGDTVAKNRRAAAKNLLHYRARFPLSPHWVQRPIREDLERAAVFTHRQTRKKPHQSKKRPIFRVLPISLPHFGQQPSQNHSLPYPVQGSLHSSEGEMTLLQQTANRSMFAAVVFDLNPDRAKKRAFWRHLTVGENLQAVSPDRAVGHRIQIGKEQFLLYHSLTEPANRTFLGHNLIDDFCFARFDPETGVEALVAIQRDGLSRESLS